MAYEYEENAKDNLIEISSWDVSNLKGTRRVVFVVNPTKEEIIFKARSDELNFIKEFKIIGFKKVPEPFSKIGYIKGPSLQYHLAKILKEKSVVKIQIIKDGQSRFEQLDSGLNLSISYADFKSLHARLNGIERQSKADKRAACVDFFNRLYPAIFDAPKDGAKSKTNTLISSLDTTLIEHLKKDEVDKLVGFFEELLKRRQGQVSQKMKLVSETKIKIDRVALSEIIEKFEKMLLDDPSENEWGKFLEKNLYLIESRYVHALPKLNVQLGTSREMDFGLVDSQGYLDIFEIKKPSTTLLAKEQDRGNYYWSTDAIKAITQAEKYLYRAERNASNLAEAIKREKGISAKIIRPRAVLLIGHTNLLKNDDQREDFRVLSMSLKNIQIVTYDELLDRLKNQLQKSIDLNDKTTR